MKIKQALTLIATLSAFFIATEVNAQDKPSVPNTLVYVTEIDEDWVLLAVNMPNDIARSAKEVEDKIYTTPEYADEVLETADFACNLYNRDSVHLSSAKNTRRTDTGLSYVYQITFLFACAIRAD